MRPRVSIAMVTYAHEAYLPQAIESVLAQDLPDWELVIGEDCSPDGTRAIAERYARAHPERIRLLDSTANLGGRRNFARVLEACRGEYFSQLDGDDYYTQTDRLRVMVEHLDARPDLAWAYHGVAEVDEQGREVGPPLRGRADRTLDRYDLLAYCPGGSSGALHRRPARFELPEWWWRCPIGDWALHVLLTGAGRVGYVDRVLSAHRNHSGSYWAAHGDLERIEFRRRSRAVLAEAFDEDLTPHLLACEYADRLERGRVLERGGYPHAAAGDYAWCWRHRGLGDGQRNGRLLKRLVRVRLQALVRPRREPELRDLGVATQGGCSGARPR